MRTTLLGTGAADIHAPDGCSCPNCVLVKQRGGRSRRTYSSAVTDGELLIDCGPTVPGQLAAVAPADSPRYLLMTHPDSDHFDPDAIAAIAAACPVEGLIVVGSTPVVETLRTHRGGPALRLIPAVPFETLEVGPWSITPLPARHRGEAGDSLIYIVTREARSLLYASDTGPLLPQALAELAGRRLEAVVAEATFGLQTNSIPDLASAHMNFPLLSELRQALLGYGTIGMDTPVVATHLSLHFCPPYEESASWLAAHGILLGYDGLTVSW